MEKHIAFAKVNVTDNGIGIPKSERHKIFETYFRGKQHLKIKGSGLGLAIAAKMLALNEGTISVRSNKPRGSIFTVKLATVN
jgi:signal transduction histidine kinase